MYHCIQPICSCVPFHSGAFRYLTPGTGPREHFGVRAAQAITMWSHGDGPGREGFSRVLLSERTRCPQKLRRISGYSGYGDLSLTLHFATLGALPKVGWTLLHVLCWAPSAECPGTVIPTPLLAGAPFRSVCSAARLSLPHHQKQGCHYPRQESHGRGRSASPGSYRAFLGLMNWALPIRCGK